MVLSALLAAGAVLACAAASAEAGKGVLEVFGSEGTGAGQFTFASGVAINQASGDLYVADATTDAGGNRVLQFAADGSFVRAWGWGVATGADAFEVCTTACQAGIPGSGDGQFSLAFGNFDGTSPQVAVDQTDGSVYVADNLNSRIQKFTASGVYVGQFGSAGSGDGQLSTPQGVAVDPSSGEVYVADTGNNRVQRFDSAGVYQSQLGAPGGGSGEGDFLAPLRAAVDSTGRLYVVDAGNGRVQRFTSAGVFDQVFAAGAYNAPTDIAIDAADHVYVAGSDADFSVKGILEFDADGLGVDVHAANGNVNVAGIAVRAATDRIYVASPFAPKGVLVLDEVTPPTAAIELVTDIASDGVVLRGSVNPQGPPDANYRFEYSTDGVAWISIPSEQGVAVGAGTSDVSVSQAVSGLEPNTEYQVRLRAFKDFNAGEVVTSPLTFTTATTPPLVRALAAGSRTDSGAWLGGEVNPRNLATSYYVEYTLADDVEYADSSRVPAAPDAAGVGSGNAYVLVRKLITGLTPNTAYRFRVVAENAAGITEGPDRSFVTSQAAPPAPAGRAYEMVSPLDKNGSHVNRDLPSDDVSTSGAAPSGDAVAYAADGPFAGIPSGPQQGQYRSVRSSEGWTTRGISPPFADAPSFDFLLPNVWFLSEDLSSAVVSTNVPMTPDASLLGESWGLYLQDNTDSDSAYRLLSVPASPLPSEPPEDPSMPSRKRFSFAGASSDMRHVVFEANNRQLTADGPATGRGVYEWAEGEVRFVSELPSGEPAEQPSAGSGKGNVIGQDYPGDHIVSEDGARLFFAAQIGFGNDKALYVRENGAATELISASERAGDDLSIPRAGVFQAATAADGSTALLTSHEKLTDDSTAAGIACDASVGLDGCHSDLYLWEREAPAGERLTDLTTADPEGGGVPGIAAATEDLSHVYFVGTGVLADGAISGEPNLYLWTLSGGVRFLLTLDQADIPVWNTERDRPERRFRDARVSADGRRLLFASRAELTATDSGGRKQVYLYDLEADRIECVSCRKDGGASSGDAWFFYPLNPEREVRMPYRLPRNLSADGERAFFETDQSLVDSDANGTADVYMWSDSELSLISSGRSLEGSKFIDASESGDDVFFTTRERLLGADTDDQVDVYDARVGGGFSEQQKPPPCVGDACQGPPPARPDLPVPSDAPPAGEPPISKRPAFTVEKLSAAARRALARGGKASLVVRVNKPGRVTARGVARMGWKARTVVAATKHARAAGRVRLPLRLKKTGLERLARTGKLRISLSVRFARAEESRTVRLTLRASKNGRGR